MQRVFAKTEAWLAALEPASLHDVVVARPLPAGIASTFSARVAAEEGLTQPDAVECWRSTLGPWWGWAA